MHAEHVSVDGSHPCGTWTSGYLKSLWRSARVYRLGLSLHFLPKELGIATPTGLKSLICPSSLWQTRSALLIAGKSRSPANPTAAARRLRGQVRGTEDRVMVYSVRFTAKDVIGFVGLFGIDLPLDLCSDRCLVARVENLWHWSVVGHVWTDVFHSCLG